MKLGTVSLYMKINIVPFESKHLDRVYYIETLSFAVPWDKASLAAELQNSVADYLIAVIDDVAVGYVGVWRILGEGHITNIAVDPQFRGLGIGSLLLKALIALMKTKNIFELTLEVRASNYRAQNLYKKFGFKEEGRRPKYYSDNDEDAIIMWNRKI